MPFDDLRSFLKSLQDKSQLARVTRQVDDKSYEVSAVLDLISKKSGKAVIFENLENYRIPLCFNLLASLERLAIALETTKQDLFQEWKKRKATTWPSPLVVSDGPCKEHVIKKEEVNLLKYPILKWNPLDGGPYVTFGILISKDPETGERNAGIYRLMVQGKNQLGVNMLPQKDVTMHYNKSEANNKPLDVAVAIGLDPAISLAAATRLKLGEDELAFAGALRNQPVKLTRCETNDLEVPASAEIVLEGKMPPNVRAKEGPFGECTGYYSPAQDMPILKVESITQRENPIYQATYTGKPPKEEHIMNSLCSLQVNRSSEGWHRLSYKAYKLLSSGRRRLTGKPIRLPKATLEKVIKNWNEYGLE